MAMIRRSRHSSDARLDRRLGVVVRDDRGLEAPIVLAVFQTVDHGLCGEPVPESVAARCALAFLRPRPGALERIQSVRLTAATTSWACRSRGRLGPGIFRRLDRRWTEQGIEVLLNGCPVEPSVLPQPLGHHRRVDAGGLPPIGLVAMPVHGPMVGAAERNGEFVADPAPQGSRLHEPQMVRIRRLPSAQKARLRRYELQMGAIAIAARFAEGKGALVDMPEDGVVHRRCLGLRHCTNEGRSAPDGPCGGRLGSEGAR
jgi:hypothetical protein